MLSGVELEVFGSLSDGWHTAKQRASKTKNKPRYIKAIKSTTAEDGVCAYICMRVFVIACLRARLQLLLVFTIAWEYALGF